MARISSFRIKGKLQHQLCYSLGLVIVLGVSALGFAENNNKVPVPKSSEPAVDFTQQIQPVLAKHCYACHGPDVQEGGLRLDQSEQA